MTNGYSIWNEGTTSSNYLNCLHTYTSTYIPICIHTQVRTYLNTIYIYMHIYICGYIDHIVRNITYCFPKTISTKYILCWIPVFKFKLMTLSSCYEGVGFLQILRDIKQYPTRCALLALTKQHRSKLNWVIIDLRRVYCWRLLTTDAKLKCWENYPGSINPRIDFGYWLYYCWNNFK